MAGLDDTGTTQHALERARSLEARLRAPLNEQLRRLGGREVGPDHDYIAAPASHPS